MLYPMFSIIMLILGIVIVVFSAIKISRENNESIQVDNTIKALNKATEEADDAMVELDKFSKSIFLEMENKYQEILYLYSLVEDQKSQISSIDSIEKNLESITGETKTNDIEIIGLKTRNKKSNEKTEEIKKLCAEGMSASVIAKKLNMGVGEVKLIMEIGRER